MIWNINSSGTGRHWALGCLLQDIRYLMKSVMIKILVRRRGASIVVGKVDDRTSECVVSNHPVQGNLWHDDDSDDNGNDGDNDNDGYDDDDGDHVAVGAPWVHPVGVHELDRCLPNRLHWTIHLQNMIIIMLVMMVMLMIMIMIMIMKMMMIMVIDTSCTAWSNCFLVITTFLRGMFGRRFFCKIKS